MKSKAIFCASIFSLAIGSILISEYSSSADGSAFGAPSGYAADPSGSGKTCANIGCHSGAPVTSVSGWISTTDIPVAGYSPDSTYTITVTATRFGHTKFGFEISPQNSGGTLQGTLINTGTDTQINPGNKYITHTSSGTTGSTGSHQWTFDWTAPSAGAGTVTFYGAFNITNSNSATSGDSTFTSSSSVSENTTGIDELKAIANHISVYPNPIITNFSIDSKLDGAGFSMVNISDINGRVVKCLQNVTSRQSINIEELANGIYCVRIKTAKGDVIKKIVKE